MLPNPAEEQFMHKNRLQQHIQRASLPLPVYATFNEGSPHAPNFRASVIVDGERFTSPSTFNNRKAAEQEVARIAFEELSRKIKSESIPLIHNNVSFCKSILHEYAAKQKLEMPQYNTYDASAGSPSFGCTVIFSGSKFTGSLGRSKKEAEQMAARVAIESILGNCDSRNFMYEIVKSKCRLQAALQSTCGPQLVQDQSMTLKLHLDSLKTADGEKKEHVLVTNGTNGGLHLVQSSLQHVDKLHGNDILLGNPYPRQPAITTAITSCSSKGNLDGTLLGKRKECNKKKKKKKKSPSKRPRNEGLPSSVGGHSFALAPVPAVLLPIQCGSSTKYLMCPP